VSEIHPAAFVDPGAEVGEGARIGPGAVVGPGARLGEGCEVGAHAVLEGRVDIASGCRIFPGAVIGTEAQFVGGEGGAGGGVEIGANTVVREMVTIHRSLEEGSATRIGEDCYLMVQAHIAHDCLLGDRVILANWTGLSGHIEVGSGAFISGYVGIHQFVRIGEGAILTGPAAVRQDVLPFTNTEGNPPMVRGLNTIGLRRSGVSAEVRSNLKKAYHILFEDSKTTAEAADRIEAEVPLGREINSVVEFARVAKRGFYRGGV
jgi:UDP-N-acetylglucosamine acyltransferase